MREIGSEFWDAPVADYNDSLFPESTQWFLSGRCALQAILKDLNDCHTVTMPSWCCDSMVKPFIDAGIEVRFYPVFFNEGLVQDYDFDADAIFLMDYFGYTGVAPDLSSYKGIVIRDVTHSLFSASYSDADYYFGSLRKWCGVWTGGYAWTSDGHNIYEGERYIDYISLRKQAMHEKGQYIDGSRRNDKEYLKIFSDAEDLLESVCVAPAAERDIELAHHLNAEVIKMKRRANAEVLKDAFRDWLIFPDFFPTDTPMFVPVLVLGDKRDALRQYLIKNEIYCPVHWPVSIYHRLNEKEQFLYDNELSLVCDQRYTEEDMNRIVETINSFIGGN